MCVAAGAVVENDGATYGDETDEENEEEEEEDGGWGRTEDEDGR